MYNTKIKRPILVAVIGYMIGIIWGLYLKNISIVFLYIIIIAIYLYKRNQRTKKEKNLKLVSIKRYLRYLKIFFNLKVFLTIIIISIISNTILIFQNKRFEYLYNREGEIYFIAIVVGNKEEKEHKNVYKIKIVNIKNKDNKIYKNKYFLLNTDKNVEIEYGDKILVNGNFEVPEANRNYGGFNYRDYLKSEKLSGIIKSKNIKILDKNNCNIINTLANNINLRIKTNIEEMVPEKYSGIFTGLILGNTDNIEEKIKENFNIANISHVLAISGMHITYIIIGVEIILKNLLGKLKTRVVIIVVLMAYMFITGFSPSIVRASIMGILLIFSKISHRRNDIWTQISLSLLILLIYNPILITNVGLQLSYLGTIGIIIFNKNIYKFLKNLKIRNRKIKYRINRKIILIVDKIKEMLSVTFSAQLAILPIMLYNFNTLGIYFFITNLLVSVIIGPIIIVGFICVIFSFISITIAKFISNFICLGIQILIQISEISMLPFSKIYLPTPNLPEIIFYYIIIIFVNKIYYSYQKRLPNNTDIRIKNLVALFKYRFNLNKKRNLRIVIITILIIVSLKHIPKDLEINFVDVGQGDSTFIITPKNQTILLDGGGSMMETDFDVGKDTVLPYILDKGYTKIDYMIISHFDQDHVRGIICNY